MARRVLAAASVALVGALSLTSCVEDPCRKLAPPNAAELAAVAAGAQVERDTPNGVECDLIDGRWQREK